MKAIAKAILEHTTPELLYRYQVWKKRDSEPELRLLPTLCDSSKLSLDVGANIGLYSYYMWPHSAAVFAFEPLPSMQERMRIFPAHRVTVHPVALSDTDGETEIRLPRGNPSWATIEHTNSLTMAQSAPIEAIKIATRRLDSYQLTNIGFIKIDVEGHEEAVIRGGLQTIRQNRPKLLIEMEERHNPGSLTRVSAMLEECGYHGLFFSDGSLHALKDFNIEQDQFPGNVGTAGRTGRYINNFIFEPCS